MQFRDLSIGTTFDFIDDAHPTWASFYDKCRKVSARAYVSLKTGTQYKIGSISAKVYHIEPAK